MAETTAPSKNFRAFAEHQKQLLFDESERFLGRHNLRLLKYVLPTTLPNWAKTFDDVLDRGQELEPFTSIYRHKHFLKCRVLHNRSYIQTKWNKVDNARNKNIPYDLRPLSPAILKQLETVRKDVTDPEFSGMLITINSPPYKPKGRDKEISKVLAGALVESLVSNERCLKCIWVHPDLSKHSSKVLLQAFLPRLVLESFQLASATTDDGYSKNNKFVYAMHNDMDLFPRQCWLLLASTKRMSLPRHYETSTFEEHPVDLKYGDCHTDEVGHLLTSNAGYKPVPSVLFAVGSEESAKQVSCNCRIAKINCNTDDQAWLDRLVGCTESYMCLLLPKEGERSSLGLCIRQGWRDFILDAIDPILTRDILTLLPSGTRNKFTPDQNTPIIPIPYGTNSDGDAEELCGLERQDISDVTSDVENFNISNYQNVRGTLGKLNTPTTVSLAKLKGNGSRLKLDAPIGKYKNRT